MEGFPSAHEDSPNEDPYSHGPYRQADDEKLPPKSPGLHRRSYVLPAILFLTTCVSTFLVGGPWYVACIMTMLTAHELGHFFQAVRYRVPASLPYFIPMPFSLFGTFGAVIFMQPHSGDRKSLFDIGITGPIAGLVPALIFSTLGLYLSEVGPVPEDQTVVELGEPLLFKLFSYVIHGPVPVGQDVVLHPMAYAGWVGLFITALNLIPIGQLDGGHILYALLRKRAHFFSRIMLAGAILGMIILQYWGWILMIMLLAVMGTKHPPTHDDNAPLGAGRVVLGWLSLAFVIVGFTPTPIVFGQ